MSLMDAPYFTRYHGLKADYSEVCDSYVDYVIKHYGKGTTVVFDGYDGTPSTKDTTRVHRTQRENRA